MRNLRRIWRVLTLSVWTSICFPALMLCSIFPAKRNITKYHRRKKVIKLWCRGLIRLVNARREVHGSSPTSPYVLVTNHLSYIDIIMLCSISPSYMIAKNEVESWPVFGAILRWSNIIYIDRTSKKDVLRVNGIMRDLFREGADIHFFAEGFSSKGERVLPFKTSLFSLPAEYSIPVHFATIGYSTPEGELSASKYVCWWGGMVFLRHVWQVLKLKSFTASIVFGGESVCNKDRKRLAESLHQKVSETFTPIK